jgi:iron complex outermembrane receptor protein
VKSYTPVDFGLTVKVEGGPGKPLVLGLDVRNLFDVKPPYVNIAPSVNGSGGYDATASDPIGRVISISARKSF